MSFHHIDHRSALGPGRAHAATVIPLPVPVFPRLKCNAGGLLSNASYLADLSKSSALERPLYLSKVAAGFPSPGDNYVERRLDLNEHLIRHTEATFFVRVNGDSMTGAGIFDNDLLIVDRAITPESGRIVVAAINGELVVKRLKLENGKVWLVSENSDYSAIELAEGMEFVVWGVVTNAVHAL